jgi:hypothetical protein
MRFVSKICSVAPEIFLARLIHKSVFDLIELGTPLGEPEATVTDEISQYIYRGGKGVVTYRCDGIRVLVEAVYFDRPILRCALRDRQLDGTNQSSPLTIFPNTDPACNRLPGADFLAAELSIYSWDPNTYLDGLDVEGTVGHFIADPDFYVWRNFEPELFFRLWEQAFFLGRAPWQTAKPMSNVPAFFVKQATEFLRELGYNRLDAVPSWFNVAAFFEKLGFSFTFGEHSLAYAGIVEGLRSFGAQSKIGAKRLTRAQQAWLVALQNIPDCYIGNALLLPARWPVTHTNMYWVRMHVDLNPYDKGAATGSSLMSKIKSLRADGETRIVLHAATYCPCTDTLGASSPAATSPRAVIEDSSGDGQSG